ncbi:MAG: cyclic nucleotide-binding domain-containing protein [Terracidiphilus sp.]
MEDGTMDTLEGSRQAEDGAGVGANVGIEQAEAMSERLGAVAAHPLVELLECPPETGNLLNGAARCFEFDAGEVVFRQHGICKGLYLVIGGVFVRKAERLKTRLTLGTARGGDLVELAAALGDGQHTYTLSAQTPGSLLLLPIESLNQVFEEYPPLRMRLLEELAREVSRAYLSCWLTRAIQVRRRGSGVEPVSTGV